MTYIPPFRPLVIIESPFAGNEQRNRAYLQWAIKDSILRGEAPFASHQMYVDCLEESASEQRKLGIECGYAFWRVADLVAFYLDHGISSGMEAALNFWSSGRPKHYEHWPRITFRKIGT